jgi:hypothetical protein
MQDLLFCSSNPECFHGKGENQLLCLVLSFLSSLPSSSSLQTLYRSSEPDKVDLPTLALRSITNLLLETVKLRRKGCYPDGTLLGDFSPSPEQTIELNLHLDEITKLQEVPLLPLLITHSPHLEPIPITSWWERNCCDNKSWSKETSS